MPTQREPSPRLTLPEHRDWRQTFWSILGPIMFGALLAALCIYTLPDLLNDWRIRDSAVPVAQGRVTEGSCSTKLVLNICDATIAVRSGGGIVTHDVNYLFVDMHAGDYSVAVLADPARPELATTDMGLEKLWNRTLTLLVAVGLLLALTLAPILALLRRTNPQGGAASR